jgi:hypothetical protein
MKAYRVKGTTDDVTTCELCGKQELKGTVVLEALDADGNAEEICYFGVSCAAKAAGWTQREVKAGIKAAQQRAASAERDRVIAAREAERAAYTAWLAETFGDGTSAAVKTHGVAKLWADFRAGRVAALAV